MKVALFAVSLCLIPATLPAQTASPGRIEVSGGLRWSGALIFPGVDALENAPGGRTSPVFTSRSQLEASPGAEARLGIAIARMVRVEASAGFNKTRLSTRLGRDTDGAPPVTAGEDVSQYLFEAGVLAQLARWGGSSARLAPFVTAGAGYLRHAHEGRTVVQTGRSYYIGAGAHYGWRTSGRGRLKGAGLRADVRASILEDGALPGQKRRVAPVAGVGLFVRF
jgi:hypothetical protein